MKKFFNKYSDRPKGFSIIELLVAISIFVVIIAMSVTVFLRALKTQKSALLLMEANDNVALAVEEMAREVRSGIDFQSGGNNLEFNDVITGSRISYALSNGAILKAIKFSEEADFIYQPITSNGIEIKKFNIILDDSPEYPPKITIVLSIVPRDPGLKNVSTNIQTSVSSRIINY